MAEAAPRRILVTGAAGFVGRHLLPALGAAFPEAAAIFEANIVTMQRLGANGWAALQRQCREDGAAATAPAKC